MITATEGIDIEHDDYHKSAGVSNSSLKVFRQDVRKYHWRYVLGNFDQERKDYFDFGSAVHDMALLGSAARVALIPDDVLDARGAKRGKAWKEFESEHAGWLLLKQDEFTAVSNCVAAIYDHPSADALLSRPGTAEAMYAATDEALGLLLKCKPDKLSGSVICDIKTTGDASPEGFAKSIVSYDYDCQAYFYKRVLSMLGHDINEFVFIAVEKTPPYCVGVYTIDRGDMQTAETLVETALFDLAERHRSGNWQPKDYGKIQRLTLPRYAHYRGEY